ncbi:MAG TPA: IS4 family transposase [Chitinophagaceae bacterium]|nr:IS4 family transposase [Chitinophagaceae bacterium]
MSGIKYEAFFGDKRIDKRGNALTRQLFLRGTRSIQSLSLSRAEQKGYYRFLHNTKATEEKLIKEITERCRKSSKGKIVLSIQDTSEVNLSAHAGRLKAGSGVGGIDDHHKSIGFKLHPSLVIDAQTCFPLGFSDIRIWNRPPGQPDKHERGYEKLPIEEKESYKWLESGNKTKECLSDARAVIIIQDREGDIFEQFLRVPDERTFLLIRSATNRHTATEERLWDEVSQSALMGQYEIHVSADSHCKEAARVALIEVRSICIDIKAPRHDRKNKGQIATLNIIEAKEINTTAKNPIIWRLLTTWPVTNYEEALMVIEWYSWRWFIEELFRMLKKEGFNIEGSELETGWAIRKLTVMLLDTIIKLMQMHIAYNEPEQANVPETGIVFSTQEQECLQAINITMEGKTKALKNPYHAGMLNHATWIIARIGGWKGYHSQRPPGMTTLLNGLREFYAIFTGWSIQIDVGTR